MKQETVQDPLISSKEDQIISKQGIEFLPISRDVYNYESFLFVFMLIFKKENINKSFLC